MVRQWCFGNANVTFCNSHSTFQIWDMAMFEVSMESQGAALKDGMLGLVQNGPKLTVYGAGRKRKRPLF